MPPAPPALSAEQLRSALAALPGWSLEAAAAPGTQILRRSLRFRV